MNQCTWNSKRRAVMKTRTNISRYVCETEGASIAMTRAFLFCLPTELKQPFTKSALLFV
jgi:hypothetical protein